MSGGHFLNCTHFPPGGEWRIKYNRAIREMDFTKKKLQQEFDDKLETEQQAKRHLERRARSYSFMTLNYSTNGVFIFTTSAG